MELNERCWAASVTHSDDLWPESLCQAGVNKAPTHEGGMAVIKLPRRGASKRPKSESRMLMLRSIQTSVEQQRRRFLSVY